jgi:hypothetical protein
MPRVELQRPAAAAVSSNQPLACRGPGTFCRGKWGNLSWSRHLLSRKMGQPARRSARDLTRRHSTAGAGFRFRSISIRFRKRSRGRARSSRTPPPRLGHQTRARARFSRRLPERDAGSSPLAQDPCRVPSRAMTASPARGGERARSGEARPQAGMRSQACAAACRRAALACPWPVTDAAVWVGWSCSAGCVAVLLLDCPSAGQPPPSRAKLGACKRSKRA